MSEIDIFQAYADSGLDGELGILSPDLLSVYFEDEDESHVAPDDETDEDILDRIERSKKAGRNLFKEEWELFEADSDCLY